MFTIRKHEQLILRNKTDTAWPGIIRLLFFLAFAFFAFGCFTVVLYVECFFSCPDDIRVKLILISIKFYITVIKVTGLP